MSEPAASVVDLDQRLLTAIGHPLRHRILLALNEGTSSPNRLAAELGEPIGRVSHHVRVLARLGAIELVDTAQRRGAVEHFYRATVPAFDDAASRRLPLSTRRALRAHDLSRVIADLRSAASGGGLDHLRAHVSYTLLDADERDLDAIAAILEEAIERLRAAATESAARLSSGEAAPIRAQLALLYFERP